MKRAAASLILSLGLAVSALVTPAPSLGAQEAPLDADVALDPGHSRADVGASSGRLREYELTLEIAQRAAALLEERGYRVRLTRTDVYPLSAMAHPDSTERTRIEQEARIAAAGRVRAYVSVHFNGHSDPRIAGAETYYNPDNWGEQAYRLAEALQRNVVAWLWEGGYAARDRGVKSDLLAGKPYGHFFSLRGPMPSVLVEGLFLSNPGDAAALEQEWIRHAMAEGYARGIAEYLGGPHE